MYIYCHLDEYAIHPDRKLERIWPIGVQTLDIVSTTLRSFLGLMKYAIVFARDSIIAKPIEDMMRRTSMDA